MFNVKQLLDQLMQATQNQPQNDAGAEEPTRTKLTDKHTLTSLLTGAGGGVLAGLLVSNKSFRKIGGSIAAYGGAAALGALAHAAYQRWQGNQNQQTTDSVPTQGQPLALSFDPPPAIQQENQSRIILAAMIAAAKADGHFDEREKQLIQDQTLQTNDAETAKWVQTEIHKALDPVSIAKLADDNQETASEIYLASLLIINEQNPQEKAYLDRLAEILQLTPSLRLEIERQLK